jgi:phosphate-selective porin OprO/OprP
MESSSLLRAAGFSLGLLAAPGLSGAQVTDSHTTAGQTANAAGQTAQKGTGTGDAGFRVVWDDTPSFRFGDVLRIDFQMKLQADLRVYRPGLDAPDGQFQMARRRLGVRGTLFKDVEFEFEAEMRDEEPILDAWVSHARWKAIQVKGGRFKAPFSLEQMTGAAQLDFVYRSRMVDRMAPGRDWGGAISGKFFGEGLTYAAGVFAHDGSNARAGDNPGADPSLIGRVTGRPLRALDFVKGVEFGVSFSAGRVPEGLYSLRLDSTSEFVVFPPVYVKGDRRRFGADVQWTPGPFSLKAELLHMYDQRLGQSISNEDLSDVLGRGFYVSGTWLVTGENKSDRVRPRRDFLTEGGPGALEVGTRYEFARFGSREHPGPPFRNPRAANILGNSVRAWTFGVNWYLNRYGKVQFNAIREDFEDLARSPIPGREVFWSYVTRFALAM